MNEKLLYEVKIAPKGSSWMNISEKFDGNRTADACYFQSKLVPNRKDRRALKTQDAFWSDEEVSYVHVCIVGTLYYLLVTVV